MRYLTVALAKGRLAELAMELFISIGMDCSEMKEKTRKLIFTDEKNKMKFILVKASDVPTYVEYGAADIGIVGKDKVLEEIRQFLLDHNVVGVKQYILQLLLFQFESFS